MLNCSVSKKIMHVNQALLDVSEVVSSELISCAASLAEVVDRTINFNTPTKQTFGNRWVWAQAMSIKLQ
jgi:hypothetical protein